MPKSSLLSHDELMTREPDARRLQDAYALISTDRRRALEELEKLANNGSVLSMLYLADAYTFGPEADDRKAERWYKSAYEANSSDAAYSLGIFYFNRERFIDAERVYLHGVANNDAVSMYWLAGVYMRDPRYKDKKAQIKDLLERAIKLGHVRSKHGLGLLLLKGKYGLWEIPRGLFLFFQGLSKHSKSQTAIQPTDVCDNSGASNIDSDEN